MNNSLRIDAHQHFWAYTEDQYRWIKDDVLARDYLPADLVPLLAPAYIDAVIAVQARHSMEENIWLLELAKSNPFIVGVVGSLEFTDAAFEGQLENLCANPRFCGIRGNVKGVLAADGSIDESFKRGIRALTAHKLTFDLLLRPAELRYAAQLTAQFPEQRFILDHIGNPPVASGELEPWSSALHTLAENPNVACKVSGMVSNADHQAWQYEDFVPYLDVVFDAFGIDRLLIASNWPVCLRAADYRATMGIVQRYIANLSEETQQAILGGNAARWYNLHPKLLKET